MDRNPNQQTAKDVLRAVCGRVLSPRFGALDREEQDALLEPHADVIAQGCAALDAVLSRAHGDGVAKAHHHLRSADAFDPEAVDEVMSSQLEPDVDAEPVDVPRKPWAGGL